MGSFLTNFHIRHDSAEQVAIAAKAIVAGKAAVSRATNGWVTLLDETSESQDTHELKRIAQAISTSLSSACFAFLVHDSDLLMYLLCDAGELRDQFNSQPDYFTAVDEDEWRRSAGKPEALESFLRTPLTEPETSRLYSRIRKGDARSGRLEKAYPDEVQRLLQFAAVLGIEKDFASVGYNYYAEAAAEDAVFRRRFKKIKGTGKSAAESRPKSFCELVRWGEVRTVKQQLLQGADPNQSDENGFSALALAADVAQPKLVRLLLDAGADPNLGKLSALGSAVTRGILDVVPLLLKAGADPNGGEGRPLLAAVQFSGDIDLVRSLIHAGADVNGRPGGHPPIVSAAARDCPLFVEILLAAGAEPNARSGRLGFTPLTIAARGHRPEIVRALLAAGARVTEPGFQGLTALAHARLPIEGGALNVPGIELRREETIKLLLAAGAHDEELPQ
jgi:hypothetical protein